MQSATQQRNRLVRLALGLLLAACSAACSSDSSEPTAESSARVSFEDLVVGTGRMAKVDDVITVHTTGSLASGKQFWSTHDKNKPLTSPLSTGRLIEGWIKGVPGMRVGGKRRIQIPWRYGYGKRGNPQAGIPRKADLVFEIELLEVQPGDGGQ